MPRPKKDYKPLNVKLNSEIMARFEKYCNELGQTKTTALERILEKHMDEFDLRKEHRSELSERSELRYG